MFLEPTVHQTHNLERIVLGFLIKVFTDLLLIAQRSRRKYPLHVVDRFGQMLRLMIHLLNILLLLIFSHQFLS